MSNCRTDTPDLPPLPSHPDSHTMAWTDREKAAIADYAREAVRLAARANVPAAIERDESMNRDYIPLPGGWELQTKGNGSTLRLVDTKTGERHGLPVGAEHIIRFIERMGMEIHAASTPTPPDEATSRGSDRQLMRFYCVDTIPALIDAQERHIRRLQAKLPPLRDEQPRNPRIA